jgi:allantoicase
MTASSSAATFSGLIDLAAEELGGRALAASDEFFAEAQNLVRPGRALFAPGKFTDRGKWMDGWESRRKRGASLDAADWCVIALGAPGEVVGFDVDTGHFVGNHPPFASIDGTWAPDLPPDGGVVLARAPWTPLLEQSPLRPDAQNLFAARPSAPVTHVRLNIFPDGGVARLRVLGRVQPRWDAPPELDAETRAHVPPELRDLAAVRNGGRALACSDAFFGPMNNLLLPGRPGDMGGGWETRRRRGPGHDWILVALGARGVAAVVEVDTRHFKGNHPERCALSAVDAPPGARITQILASDAWRPLVPEARLGPDARHFLAAPPGAPATHVRLDVFPDGGVARLRIWGRQSG